MSIEELTTEQLEAILKGRHEQKIKAENEKRSAYEGLKENTINELSELAIHVSDELAAFKAQAFEEMRTLYTLLQEYSNRHADGKGNFGIENKAGTRKVEFSRQQLGSFDERAVQAEKHIIDFVNTQFGGDPVTHKLITGLLERKKGTLDINLVQKLYSMENDYQDQNWKDGIRLLKESWKATETKDYIRFWKRENNEWKQINLNFSSVAIAEKEA